MIKIINIYISYNEQIINELEQSASKVVFVIYISYNEQIINDSDNSFVKSFTEQFTFHIMNRL